jgi:hypothetical protein
MMRAMHLKDVRELDKLLDAPTSQEAAMHSEPPDEELEQMERANQELDRQRDAQQCFNALRETKFLN